MNSKRVFEILSYLSIPFFGFGIYFLMLFINALNQGLNGWEILNNTLILFGVALAFLSLKDATRKATFFSKLLWNNPVLSILTVIFFAVFMSSCVFFGLSILFFSSTSRSETIGVGFIVLGIGMIGYLKYLVERKENFNSK